jgi:hypothetical protein
MQGKASLPSDQFIELLGRLPPDLNLDSLARETKAIERNRKVDSGAILLRLALARGPGGLSLSATAAWATMLGLPSMSDPGMKYRLDKAVGFLNAVMTSQLEAKSAGPAPACAGPGVFCGPATAPASASVAAREPTGVCMRCTIWDVAASRTWS